MQSILVDSNLFFDQLNNSDSDEEEEMTDTCLISCLPLQHNAITLPCNHKFNYTDLVKAIIKQKTVNTMNIIRLKTNEIQCPYCRCIYQNILPFIPCEEFPQKISGVTSPTKYSMNCFPCQWIMKSGKNKGKHCGCFGYENNNGIFCSKHHKLIASTEKLPKWDNSMDHYLKYTVAELKDILHKKNLKKTGNKTTLILRIASSK